MDFGGEAVDMEMGNWVGGGGGGDDDQAIWATDDEYANWNDETTSTLSTYNTPDSLPRPSSSKAIGKMFYKTKLCSKFRAGVCPYVTTCNFAHTLQELRKPPPNWQDIVAAHQDEHGEHHHHHHQREEHQIPIINTSESRNESQRSYKGRHCKKFYTEEGCPFGDTCTFLHDEQSRSRESVTISVSPTLAPPFPSPPPSAPTHKPSNWKTRICNKWETTGSCPFGPKCHFAHGFTELHKFGGEGMEGETKQGNSGVKAGESSVGTNLMTQRQDFHQVGLIIPSQRPSSVTHLVGHHRPLPKWKGPDKISRIYGDWIDDFE